MRVKKQNLLWMLAGLAHGMLSHAQTQPIYEIEIIAFEQPSLTAALNEQWPEVEPSRPAPRLQRLFSAHLAEPDDAAVDDSSEINTEISENSDPTDSQLMEPDPDPDTALLHNKQSVISVAQELPLQPGVNRSSDNPLQKTEITRANDFTLLTNDQFQLKKLTESLRRKRLTKRILLHTGWRQPIYPAKAAIPVLLEGGDPLSPNQPDRSWLHGGYQGYFSGPISLKTNEFSLPEFELSGTVSFYETRYPRIETNLCQTVEPHLLTNPLVLITNSDQLKNQGFQQVCNREIRGLSYGELIYFDSPTFGLIVQIREQLPVENQSLN